MANWYVGEPSLRATEVVPVKQVWRCPETGCDGEMIYVGMDWPTAPPGHHHDCNKCGVRWVTRAGMFPRVIFQEKEDAELRLGV